MSSGVGSPTSDYCTETSKMQTKKLRTVTADQGVKCGLYCLNLDGQLCRDLNPGALLAIY